MKAGTHTSSALAFCLALDLAHARLRRKLDEELGTHHGLDMSDLVLLQALSDGSRTPAQLERPLGKRASHVLRQVLALEKSGWVRRTQNERGQRAIELRPPGRRLLGEAMDTAGWICEQALAGAHDAQDPLTALCESRALELR